MKSPNNIQPMLEEVMKGYAKYKSEVYKFSADLKGIKGETRNPKLKGAIATALVILSLGVVIYLIKH